MRGARVAVPSRASPSVAVAAGCAVAAALVFASACKRSGAKKIAREADAQAVVVVDTPAEAIEFAFEVEPNGEIAASTRIADALRPGAIVGARGALDGETDVDQFAITIAEPGALRARVSGIDGVDLILDLRRAGDPDGVVLARSDRGPALVIEGFPNYPVEAGEYFLAVSEFVKKRKPRRGKRKGVPPPEELGRTGPSPTYELTVELVREPPQLHERELNDDVELAGDLLLGDERLGWMGWARDVDMWRIPVEGFTAQYALDIDLEGVPGVTFTLAVLDPAGVKVLERVGAKDGGVSVRNLIPGLREDGASTDGEGDSEGGDEGDPARKPAREPARASGDADAEPGRYFYAVLSARRSNPLEMYRLRVSSRVVDPGEEREPNDAPEQAAALLGPDAVSADAGEVTGYLTAGDTDCFVYTAAGPTLLDVELSPADDLDVNLEVLGPDEAVVAESNAGKRGGAESVTAIRVVAGKRVTVRITGRGASAPGASLATYKLSWSVVPDDGSRAGSPDSPDGDDSGDPGLLQDEYESD